MQDVTDTASAVARGVLSSSALAGRGHAWRAPLPAIICSLLATVLALGGCGSGAAPDAQSHAGKPTPLERGAVYSFLAASGAQLAQGNAFYLQEAQLIDLGTAQCMKAHLFSAADETFIRYDEEYLNPPQGSPVAPGFEGMDSSAVPGLVSMELLSRKGSMLTPVPIGAPPRPYNLPYSTRFMINTDFIRCQRQAARSFALLNIGGGSLNALWVRDVSAIQASRALRAATARFGTCARGRGVPPSASSSPSLFERWLELLVRPAVYPYGRTALIRSLVARDRHWTEVFVTCAGSLESRTQRLQLHAQKAFFQSHYQRIQSLELDAAQSIRSASVAS